MNNELDEKGVIEGMSLALRANIEFLKQEGNSQFTVRNGQFIDDVGGVFVYEFTLDFLQEIDPDTEIEVRVRNQSVSGKLTAVDDRKVRIQLEENIGASIAEARIVISSYHLLQTLHDKLQKTQTGEITLSKLANKTFGLIESEIGLDETYSFPILSTNDRSQPNEFQEKAIRQALGSEVLFIWGPPGTGKTTTIAQIIEGFIERGMSVLLLAHTNVATDGAFGDFIEIKAEENDPDYLQGKFVRVGKVALDTKLSRYEMVKIDVIEAKNGASVRKEINSLQEEAEKYRLEINKSQSVISEFEKAETLEVAIKHIEEETEKMRDENEYLEREASGLKYDIQSLKEKISQYQSKGAIGKFFSVHNLEDLTKQKAKKLIELENFTQRLESNIQAVERGREKYKNFTQERDRLLERVKGVDRSKLEKIIELSASELESLEEQIRLLAKQLDELRASIVKDAKVVSTTLTKSYTDKIVLDREYDCVIVDEASMAPLPALWYATGLAKKKVVVVGDFYQLPPVVKHKVLKERKTNEEVEKEEILVKEWLSGDIFKAVGITDAIARGDNPPSLRQLKIQYRMHPDIAEVINTLVYSKGGGKFALTSGESTYNNGKGLLAQEPLSGFHMGIYDTSEIKSLAARTDSGSYYNLYNAVLCTELAKQALNSGYKTVGIVTPFRPQANLIQKIVIDTFSEPKNDRVAVDTVHRFQGGQKELMIFDTVTPQPTKLTDDNSDGGDDEKLINVAFSRAQYKCLVVADVPSILKKHSPTSLFRKYFDYCSEKGFPVKPTKGILSDYAVLEETEKWLEKIYDLETLDKEFEASSVFNQIDFYKRFINDIKEAKQEVIVDSPYITQERMRIFFPIFNFLLQKGVKIFVLTRVPEEHAGVMRQYSEEAIKEMDSMGIYVLPFKGQMHRKLAVIDRKIVWEGSLNILSQRDSQEFMRRVEGIGTAKQIMQFLKIEKNIGPIGSPYLEKCEFCDKPGAWYWTDASRFGVWTYCLVGIHKKGAPPKTEAEKKERKKQITKARKAKKEISSDGSPICQEHDLPMIKRKGRWGEFWGCQRYPRCRITEKVR